MPDGQGSSPTFHEADGSIERAVTGYVEASCTPEAIEVAEPSVQISMGDGGLAVKPPRGFQTMRPFEGTPGFASPMSTQQFLGVPMAPRVAQPVSVPVLKAPVNVARGSTDLPFVTTDERPPLTKPEPVASPIEEPKMGPSSAAVNPAAEREPPPPKLMPRIETPSAYVARHEPTVEPAQETAEPPAEPPIELKIPRLPIDTETIPPVVVTLEADEAGPMVRKLGNYEILQLIGSGGMAEVFLARHTGPMGFEKIVVLKCIHAHLAREPQFVSMFLDEARLAARINDPRVVQIYELGEANETYFMAMEYLEGETLSTLVKHAIRSRSMLPIGLVARVVADAAAGLHSAHELRDTRGRALEVVHRDVSHGNIVVLYSGAVKVLDFGVAKARSSLATTTAGERKGKYGYMSPEQVLGEHLDRRSDVFSLGIVLWEALTKKSLFLADSEPHALRKILEGVVPAPSTLRPEIPPALDDIVLRALAKDRRHRFQSAAEMAAALEGFLHQPGFAVGAHDLSSFMKGAFAERISQRASLLRVTTGENAPLPVVELQRTRTSIVTSTDAIEKLETMQRRGRRRLTAVAIAAPLLFAVAFLLGRRPTQDAPASIPAPVVEQVPVTKPVTMEPAVRERSLSQALLDRAEIAIRNGRVAAPPGDNALEFILDAEKQEPGSRRARTLRDQAIEQLLAAGDELWRAGKQESARTMYADVLLFDASIEIAKQRSQSPRPVSQAAPPKDVAWMVAEIDLAIIERRLVAPAGRNALELLQQLRRVDPTNEAVRRLGVEVAAAVKVEVKARPGDAKLQMAVRALARPEASKPMAAVETEKARDPVLARQLIGKGNTHLGSGRLADARVSFERAVAADSGAHAALAGLAEVAYNESDYTRAVLAAKRAIALAPASSGHRMLLGKAYYKLLRYADAIKQWKKALELDPRNTAAQKNIEMAQRRMGR